MQIAQIVPKVRTQNEGVFDYSIPPEILPQVKIGILVVVPFHGRNIEGIVINLRRQSQITKLKNILKIIDPTPVVNETHIKLAKWMSDYYLSPFSKTLFENIVPPAKRVINKLNPQNIQHPSSKINSKYNKYLVIGDFKTRLRVYLNAINKTTKKNRNVIILVPDLSIVQYFTKYIKDYSILHAGLKKTERWQEWDKIRRGKIKIVIGSQSALFAPTPELGLIIIDQEENETYKNYQNPRFHSVTVANKLAELTNSTIILGSLTPRVETYFSTLKNKYQVLKSPQNDHPNISIVDLNTERYLISNTLEKAIEVCLANNKKIMLVLNKKGEGNKYSCPQCGWVAKCINCNQSLVPKETNNFCFRCEKEFPFPTDCPKCHNVNLKSFGLGTNKLKKFLSDLFPKIRIIQIEKDKIALNNNWDIAISTSYGLKFPWVNIELVAIINADQSLNFPDFSSAQNTFNDIYKFLKIGCKGIIQTYSPENPTILALASLNYEKFFLEEIELRNKFLFPPFAKLVKLIYKNNNLSLAKKESLRVNLILKKFKNYSISVPYQPFYEKDKINFRYQIVVKSDRPLDDEIKGILRTLPKGWVVDVDPVNLL